MTSRAARRRLLQIQTGPSRATRSYSLEDVCSLIIRSIYTYVCFVKSGVKNCPFANKALFPRCVYEHLQEDRGQILEELEKESNKRQQVITEARKKMRADAEFDARMRELYTVEERLKRRLTAIEQEVDTYPRLDWEEKVNEYVTDLQAGSIELNNTIAKTPEEQHRVFLMKKTTGR